MKFNFKFQLTFLGSCNFKSTARTSSKSCNVPGKLYYYYALRKQYKQLIRKKQRQYKSKLFLNSLIDLENNDSKSFWKVVNEFKNSDTSVSDQHSNIAPGFSISMV